MGERALHAGHSRRAFLISGSAIFLAASRGPAIVGHPALVSRFTPEQQDRLFSKPVPFIARFSRAGHELVFVAAEHGSEGSGETFRAIRSAFRIAKPHGLVVEGFPTSLGLSPQKFITKAANRTSREADSYDRGEDVYAISLAVRAGVPFVGGDVTDLELYSALVKQGFRPEDIAFSAMFGPLVQDRKAGVFNDPIGDDFDRAYRRWATIIFPSYPARFLTEPEVFRSWYAKIFARRPEADPKWADRGGPGEPEIPGQIGNAVNLIRDRHLFQTMLTMLNERRSVVVVFGGSHLSSLWDALVDALGKRQLLAPDDLSA